MPAASFGENGELALANSENSEEVPPTEYGTPTSLETELAGLSRVKSKVLTTSGTEFNDLSPAEFEVPTISPTKSEPDLTTVKKPPVIIGVQLKKASPASPEKRRTFPRTTPRARGSQSKNSSFVETKKIFLATMINGDAPVEALADQSTRAGVETVPAPNPIWSTHPQLKSTESLVNSNTEESRSSLVQDCQDLSNSSPKIPKISAPNTTADASTNPPLKEDSPMTSSDSNSTNLIKKESTASEDVSDAPPKKSLQVNVLLPSVKDGSETGSPSIQVTPPTPLIYPTFPRHEHKKLRIKFSSMENLELDANNVANTALRELENRGKPTAGMAPSKSTLIVHSVQRVKLDKDGRWHEVEQANGEGKDSPSSKSDRGSLLGSSSPSASDRNDIDRARSKERKSFMGTLRKRLSFKKNRSKSMEQKDESLPESLTSSRSVSADRSRSVPSSRETSTPRLGVGRLDVPDTHVLRSRVGARLDNSSTRSSVSEGSAVSGASSRTYINENSTLIIEATENGVTKYYLIPFSLASRSKWRKKGVKLHVYNDHTFVAKHVTGPTVCQACTRRFSRRPGKQGYECRDCNLQCHKTCHVKVETRCPTSTIHSLEMEYVQDPKAKAKIS